MLIIKKKRYGTLTDIALDLGLGRSTLKVTQKRYGDKFPKPIGYIAGAEVFDEDDVIAFREAQPPPGRPKKEQK